MKYFIATALVISITAPTYGGILVTPREPVTAQDRVGRISDQPHLTAARSTPVPNYRLPRSRIGPSWTAAALTKHEKMLLWLLRTEPIAGAR